VIAINSRSENPEELCQALDNLAFQDKSISVHITRYFKLSQPKVTYHWKQGDQQCVVAIIIISTATNLVETLQYWGSSSFSCFNLKYRTTISKIHQTRCGQDFWIIERRSKNNRQGISIIENVEVCTNFLRTQTGALRNHEI
jgi:hypothetical protein